jgi:hypothetical protein
MATLDSRLGPGTLTLGTTDRGAQVSNCRLVPSNTSTDGTPTLGTPAPSADIATTWALTGSAIQDWEDPAGFVEYCRINNNTEVAFEWEPNSAKGISYTGTCKVVALEIGGDVAVQNTSAFEFSLVGEPVRSDAAAGVPSAPRNASAVAEGATIAVVDWDAPTSGSPTSYDVYQSATEAGVYSKIVANITKTGTTARVSSLTTATTYWFKVSGTNGTGEGVKSGAATVTTP